MLNNAEICDFIPLADWLRETRLRASLPLEKQERNNESVELIGTPEILSFIEEIALLRLRVAESFECAKKRLLENFAEEVLGRELRLSPADINAVAQKALLSFAEKLPVFITVSEIDAACLHSDFPVRIDAALQPGDIVVDVADGRFESPIRLRVAHVTREALHEEKNA